MALPDMKLAGPPIVLLEDHVAFAFDEGMSRYAIRLRDGTVRVHRMSDNQEIARFKGDGDRDIFAFTFSPDGRYLASANHPNRSVSVWDVDRKALCLRDPGDVSTEARFSPDSRRVAMGHNDGSLLVYDLTVGQPIKRWHGPAAAANLAYRPDGKQMAVSYHTSPPNCHILDAETGAHLRAIPLDIPVLTAWSPDGKKLVMPGKDDQILIYNAATGERTVALKGASGGGVGAVFDATGTMVISNGWQGRLRLWDAVLGQQILSLTAGGLPICSRDNRIPIWHGRSSFWQIDTAIEYRTLAHASGAHCLSIRRDGRILAAGTGRGVVLWDLARGAELGFLPIGLTWGSNFEASGDLLTNVAAGVWRWPVQVDPTKGEFRVGPPRRLLLPGTAQGIVADRAGRTIATTTHDLAYIAVGDRTLKVGPLDDCRSLSVSSDGQWFATGSWANGGATVWKLPEGTPVVKLVEGSCAVSFSPDGKWLATTSQGTTRLWEVGTWLEGRRIDGDFRYASEDGRLAVFRDSSRNALLVELQSGLILARFESPDQHQVGDANQLGDAILSPDGSSLAVLSADSPPCVHVWDLRAIRRRLAEMGLDWDAPPYPEADSATEGAAARPLRLVVDMGK
jgi:WD40 repeat protein